MPNFSNSQIPAPEGWEEFQDICRDLWSRIWKDPNAQQNGRKGQTQKGVDIFGRPNGDGGFEGVQCKCIDIINTLSEKVLKEEIAQALKFEPPLKKLIIATTGLSDAKIQEMARLITEKHKSEKLFSVDVISWKEIYKLLGDYPELQIKHYPQFFDNANYEQARTFFAENQELRKQIQELGEAAKNRLVKAADKGQEDAKSIIERLKKDKNLKGLLTFLKSEYEKAQTEQESFKNNAVEINRERFAVAYSIGDIEVAQEAITSILRVLPSDLSALNNQAQIHYLKGDLEKSVFIYNRIKAVAIEKGDLQSLAAVEGNLGVVAWVRGDLVEAEKLMIESLTIYIRLNKFDGMSNLYGNLGLVYRSKGDLKNAEKMMLEALKIDEKMNNKFGQAGQLNNLSGIYIKTGFLPKAKETMNKSLNIYEDLQNVEGISTCCTNLGMIHKELGELKLAEELINKGLEIDGRMGNLLGQANGNNNLGLIYRENNEPGKAEEAFLKSLEFNKKLNRLDGIDLCRQNLGLIYKERGEFGKAKSMFLEALDGSAKRGNKDIEAASSANLGLIYLIEKNYEKGYLLGKKALEMYESMGMVKEALQVKEYFKF